MSENVSNHQDCNLNDRVTSHGRTPILTLQDLVLSGYVYFAILLPIVSFGIPANIINIIIFYKQGFRNVINITFFSIALSDLLTIIFIMGSCIITSPTLQYMGFYFEYLEVYYVYYLMVALPHVYFSRITVFSTAFLAIERCLSVLVPLKVHRIITPRRTVIILILLAFTNGLIMSPEYLGSSLKWIFHPEKNVTLLGLVYNRNGVAGFLSYIFVPPTGIMALLTVVVFTAILVYQLRQKSKWRKSATHDNRQGGAISTKDKGTIRMVIVIASVLIFLTIPGVFVLPWVTVAEPEFQLKGVESNLFIVVWGVPLILQAINSSMNIFFYYRMSSSFRQLFRQLFPLFPWRR